MKKELLQALKERNLYDYIANNYWRLSKEELAFIGKELAFAVYQVLKDDEKLVFDEMIDNVETELDDED